MSLRQKNNGRIRVGLIFGGKSPEHEVSVLSAKGILQNIDSEKFSIIEIGIDKAGDFWTAEKLSDRLENGVVEVDGLAGARPAMAGVRPFDFFRDGKDIDVYFPILHGAGGEDGEIQGLIRSTNKKFVGADILASAICLDKGIFKSLLAATTIPQTAFKVLDFDKMRPELIKRIVSSAHDCLRFPIFVKPCNLGSSVGISKVSNTGQLSAAVDSAKKFDSRIVIEESVENAREIEVSVLGNGYADIRVSLPGEIVPGAEFYDYNDKYKNDKSRTIAPADLPADLVARIQEFARAAYDLVCCRGFARVDFLLNDKGHIFLNEINTLPGFTPISMYPKMWEASGLSFKNLVTKLIELAL